MATAKTSKEFERKTTRKQAPADPNAPKPPRRGAGAKKVATLVAKIDPISKKLTALVPSEAENMKKFTEEMKKISNQDAPKTTQVVKLVPAKDTGSPVFSHPVCTPAVAKNAGFKTRVVRETVALPHASMEAVALAAVFATQAMAGYRVTPTGQLVSDKRISESLNSINQQAVFHLNRVLKKKLTDRARIGVCVLDAEEGKMFMDIMSPETDGSITFHRLIIQSADREGGDFNAQYIKASRSRGHTAEALIKRRLAL